VNAFGEIPGVHVGSVAGAVAMTNTASASGLVQVATDGSLGESYECTVLEMSPEQWSKLPSSPTALVFRHMQAYGSKITKRMRDIMRLRSGTHSYLRRRR
jgi:hypothetical protein